MLNGEAERSVSCNVCWRRVREAQLEQEVDKRPAPNDSGDVQSGTPCWVRPVQERDMVL
jgi:hypothetical protein